MKRIHIAAAAACLALALALSSCDNSYGVLSSIQKEVASTTDSVFYRASVQNVVRFGSNYFATMNAIYSRPVASGPNSGWNIASVGGSIGTNYYCSRIAVVSSDGGLTGTMYAVLRNRDTYQTMKGVYSSADGSSFSPIPTQITKDVQALYVANDTLFAVTNEGTSSTGSSVNLDQPIFNLYYFDGSAFQKITTSGIGGTSSWIPGVVYDGVNYFTGVGSAIYYASDTAFTTSLQTKAVSGSCTSLASDPDTTTHRRAFIGTDWGYIYGYSESDSTWYSTAPWGAGSSSGDVAAVKALAYLPVGNGRLVAGKNMYNEYTSTYYGYYEIALSDTTSAGLTSSSSYVGDSSSAALHGGDTTNYDTTTKYLYVNNFYYDPNTDYGPRLFIAGRQIISKKLSGLWSDLYDGSKWGGWTTE